MQVVITIVSALLLLTALIVVHEFGHYIVAKRCGIKVDAFAIGFGPRLIKWRRNETEFSIRPIFIGGFVRFADDIESEPKPGDFRTAPLRKRFATIAAGPLMNILLAIVLSIVILMAFGDYEPAIATIEPGTPAYEAGLQEGDVIKSINGVRIDFASYDMQDYYKKEQGSSLPLLVERNGEQLVFDIPYMQDELVDGRQVTGFSMTVQPKTFNFFEAFALSFKWLFLMMRDMFSALGQLFFMGQGLENMAGIVGTVSIVGQAVHYGLRSVLLLTAMISVNLAIINLLPIPALDGGKIVMYAVEGIRKKPTPEKLEGVLNFIGFALIMGLAVILVFQDISRLMT